MLLTFGFLTLGRGCLCSYLTSLNYDDCTEAGRRLHGTPRLEVMPDGVHDVCIVDKGDGGQVSVVMR